MYLYGTIFKCSVCNEYIEKDAVVNPDDSSDNHICTFCSKNQKVK